MDRKSPEGRLLSRFEGEILDPHHKTLSLWSQPRDQAIFATLAAFDLFGAPNAFGIAGVEPDVGTVQRAKSLNDSIVFALRFLAQGGNGIQLNPQLSDELIDDASEFLLHCQDYATVYDFHVGFNRGLYGLDVSEAEKRIRFVSAPVEGAAPESIAFLEGHEATWNGLRSAMQSKSTIKGAFDILKRIPRHFENGHVVLDDVSALSNPALIPGIARIKPPETHRLDDCDDLGGFTAADFRQFWHVIFCWSIAACGAYMDAWLSGKPQRDHLPTQLLERDALISQVSAVSQLSTEIVARILDRMTFGACGARSPDIFLQPFLAADTLVAWSPFLIQVSAPERNMLKLMARTEQLKNIAADLIGKYEIQIVREVGQLLAGYGWQFKTLIDMPDNSGEIDILAFQSKYPEEVLLVEVKAVLDVDEVNEVQHATDELEKGQKQLRRVSARLDQMSVKEKQAIWSQPDWSKVTKYCGLVVTPNADPNSSLDQREIPTVTVKTLREKVRRARFKSPKRLVDTCSEKPWLNEFVEADDVYIPVEIGGVTYEIPGCQQKDDDAENNGCDTPKIDVEAMLNDMLGTMVT